MDFNAEVIDKSHESPVVVDFWAPWCGPCKTLGPIIEGLHTDGKGTWDLVKVNTDEHPELMDEYGIRGIPSVKLFHQGKVTAEFTGALPKHQLEEWLEDNIPNPVKLKFAELLAAHVDTEVLHHFVLDHPDFTEGKVELAKRTIFDQPELSRAMIDGIRPGHKFFPEIEALITLQQFLAFSTFDGSPVSDDIKEAKSAAEKSDHETALDKLISAVKKNKGFAKDLPRKTCIAYFQWLGSDHSVTKKYRRRFDMALY